MTKLTAVNADTNDQDTIYAYGVTTTGGSEIHSNELLWKIRYPATTEDVVHKYNRQGQVIERVDENATEHDYVFDDLGRLKADKVTNPGSGIDNAVLRIDTDYEIRGMVQKVTSYDAASGGRSGEPGRARVQLVFADQGELAEPL